MTGTNDHPAEGPTGEGQRAQLLAMEATELWILASDRSRWGFLDEANELRSLATVKRVQSVIHSSMGVRAAR